MMRGPIRSGNRWGVLVLGAVLVVTGAWVGADARNNVPATYSDKNRQEWVTPAAQVFDRRMHFAGGVWMSLENDGKWGNDHVGGVCREDMNLLKINYCPSFETPGGSRIDYLYNGGLWIGGIVGSDTLVSLAYEGWTSPGEEFVSHAPLREGLPPGYRSFNGIAGEDAPHLEQTYYTVYDDTTVTTALAATHIPLGLEVVQVTHQGSDEFSRDFVIFDLTITNVGENVIQDLYISIFNDCDAFHVQRGGGDTFQDDISGFLDTWPNSRDPQFRDTLNVGWAADNDGDPRDGNWDRQSARGVMAWRILRQPKGTSLSFNWWTSDGTARQDWGPRLATDTRNLGHGGNGTPSGDRNKYHYMSNNEIDYTQLLSAEDLTDEGWRPPLNTATACNLADGLDTRSMLTVGPVEEFRPGDVVPFTFALIGGNKIHVDPTIEWNCNDPYAFIGNLDFSDLALNAWWAGNIFDTYGKDTDNDGYGGEFFAGSSIPYSGDGVPDFSGPEGPRCPTPEGTCDTIALTDTTFEIRCGGANMWLISRPGELEVNWSGAETELEPDPLVFIPDWEGYKIYLAEGEDRSDIPLPDEYALLASWDRSDFRLIVRRGFTNNWELRKPYQHPRTAEQWGELFADESLDPAAHPPPARPDLPPPNPYEFPDPANPTRMLEAYFEMQDYNMGNMIDLGAGVTGPNLIQRVEVRDSVVVRDGGEVDTIGQYGIYRVVIKPKLPTRHYFVSVTAFDFGNPMGNVNSTESSVGDCFVDGIPIFSADVVESNWNLGGDSQDSVRISVYPNPYLGSFVVDGVRTSYIGQGFEGLGLGQATDEARRIHFINLPDTATIRIYSLDGDLVRELQHPDPVLTSYSSKISWDLVSRNTQAVESGIYIYRVDSRLGTHMGKIVIIK